jgi:hypothetical protein
MAVDALPEFGGVNNPYMQAGSEPRVRVHTQANWFNKNDILLMQAVESANLLWAYITSQCMTDHMRK